MVTRKFAKETDNSDRVIAPADPAAKSSPASEKEQAARAAIQACAGRVLDDSEWQRVRSRLLAYASLLGAWQRNAVAHAADLPEAA